MWMMSFFRTFLSTTAKTGLESLHSSRSISLTHSHFKKIKGLGWVLRRPIYQWGAVRHFANISSCCIVASTCSTVLLLDCWIMYIYRGIREFQWCMSCPQKSSDKSPDPISFRKPPPRASAYDMGPLPAPAAPPPSVLQLTLLGNGYLGSPKSVVVRSELQVYVFNCGEETPEETRQSLEEFSGGVGKYCGCPRILDEYEYYS